MTPIKQTLAELDALREKATQGEWYSEQSGTMRSDVRVRGVHVLHPLVSAYFDGNRENAELIVTLHNAYPAIRAYIEKLEREAEAGRVLAEAIENADRRITQNGADLAVYDALSAYNANIGGL